MAKLKRIGFGQVEPNHLSAQRTGQIYAQLPAKDDIDVLENGQFVKYNYADGVVDFGGAGSKGVGEWMMVFNEVKLYDSFSKETYKDWAMQKKNYTPGSNITHEGIGPFAGTMYPRVIKTNVGDIYTTNCLKVGNTGGKTEVEMEEYTVGDTLAPNADGYLEITSSTDGMLWQVVKIYIMADGQAALKLMRVQ